MTFKSNCSHGFLSFDLLASSGQPCGTSDRLRPHISLKVMMSASSFLPVKLWSHVGKDAAAWSPERRNGFKQHAHLDKGKKLVCEAVGRCEWKALEQAAVE